MGGINVKNTIVERIFQIVAPHPCFGCGKVGVVLCDNCKYDIINDPFVGCILCAAPEKRGVCDVHHSPLARSFVVGVRDGALQKTIDGLKFSNVKAAARVLAELLDETLPLLPSGTRIVPIPTVRSHIRTRGYDQVELIARHLSELRKIPVERALERVTSDTQHTVGRRERKAQAQKAFKLTHGTKAQVGMGPILLLDDIVTTGSTLSAAAEVLSGGAPVWAGILAYQPLD